MELLTQTRPNCWQLCVAMLLGLLAEALPDQVVVAGRSRDLYAHALRVYLRKHHRVTYAEIDPLQAGVGRDMFHLLIGETARTSENDAWHAIVGRGGVPYWDVHPSRAGLTKVYKWGVLIPIPSSWEVEWGRREAVGDRLMRCACAMCSEESSPLIETGGSVCRLQGTVV